MTIRLPNEIATALEAYCDQHDFFTINDFIASHSTLPHIEGYRAAIGRWLKLSGYVRGFIREDKLPTFAPGFDIVDAATLKSALEPLVAAGAEFEVSALLAKLHMPSDSPETYKAVEGVLRELGLVEFRRKMPGNRVDYVWRRGA